MKKILSIMIVVWGIAVLCTLFLSSCKRPEVLDNSTLVNSARNVALTFGPAYVPYFKEANVSDVQVFKKEDYGGDSRPQIRKQIGRKFYTVTFTYDSTAVKFDFGFAARVRIWKDTGEPLDVIFGNGWGRNFLFKTFVEQTNHSPNDYEKVASDSIVKVPLQTVHEPENIWNSNADNKQDSLSTRDFLTNTEKEKIKELASQVPDSIRNRFANLVDKWNFAIDHNPKTLYSASIHSYAKLPEFIPLKSMGKQIVPLIMERMINSSDFYFLVLYEAVLEGNETNDDSKFSESEQIRAIRCVKKWLKKQ